MQTYKVSVIIPSYNHGRFINAAIDSVLRQTFQDFEIIISDDCSTDDTMEKLCAYQNVPNIRVYRQSQTLGPVAAIQYLVRQSRAKYIALLNSDDMWEPEKLAKQVSYMEVHPETVACFTHALCVNENGDPFKRSKHLDKIFTQPNRSAAQWVRYFWDNGNCICHPSVLVKREIYCNQYNLNDALRQLPDYDLWVRIFSENEIHIIQEPLTLHRRLNGKKNTSGRSFENVKRHNIEQAWIQRRMITEIPDELFVEAFQDLFRCKDSSDSLHLRCEKFFLLKEQTKRNINLDLYAKAYYLENGTDEAFMQCMKDCYDFGWNVFQRYMAEDEMTVADYFKAIVKRMLSIAKQSRLRYFAEARRR